MGNHRSRIGWMLLGIVLFAAVAMRVARADDESLTLKVGNLARTYALHVPRSFGPHPALLLAFHGHGGTGAGMARMSDFDTLADQNGFIVAYPDGIDRGWNDDRFGASGGPDDLAFTTALVDALEARYPIDRSRVYAAGMSNGAIFAETIACRLGDRFAAIGVVAGSLPVPDRGGCPATRPISVVQINGSLDPVVPFDGGSIGTLGTRGSVMSVPDTVAFWAAHDACPPTPKVRMLELRTPRDGTSVRLEVHADCRNGTAVDAYEVLGAGHVWPGSAQHGAEEFVGKTTDQLAASYAIFAFFKEHSLVAPSR